MADINIAIIGGAGVGKSTLIQRALGLHGLPTSIASSVRMSVDNVVYTVSLIELDMESFDINTDRRIQWPKQINGHIVPRMDGALLLYDVMNRESITELPQTLSEPTIFVMKQRPPLILISQMRLSIPPCLLFSCRASVTIPKILAKSMRRAWKLLVSHV
jgi:hypothetical protein